MQTRIKYKYKLCETVILFLTIKIEYWKWEIKIQ
jgi:hypothetical protein